MYPYLGTPILYSIKSSVKDICYESDDLDSGSVYQPTKCDFFVFYHLNHSIRSSFRAIHD